MADIIKTWPAFMDRRKVMAIFRSKWAMFYFTLGKGKPAQAIEHLWFTHQGEILGRFKVQEIVCNVGQLPKLRSLENRESEWQIKRDRYVAVCPGPFAPTPSPDPVYFDSFRGFRYFDFHAYAGTPESRIAI
jgi:hypothetical protein